MKIAVVCAAGIGDALILHTASYHFRKLGFEVATFSNHLALFGAWLQNFSFHPQPTLDRIEEIFAPYDAIFLQHDAGPKARAISALQGKKIYRFIGSYKLEKHGPFNPALDFALDTEKTVLANLQDALRHFFPGSNPSKENGLASPPGLIHRKFAKRVVLHPTSTDPAKNWPKRRFLKLARWLQRSGYEPWFIHAPWEEEMGKEFPSFAPETLAELCLFLYESGWFVGNDSGPGHIASCLQIPNLIIGGPEKKMRFWKPDWLPALLAVPPSWVPNIKYFRLKEERWKLFITTEVVKKSFKLLENRSFEN